MGFDCGFNCEQQSR